MRWSTVVVLGLVVLTGASAVGSPVQLSYVYSDSMTPTLHVGDGYVLVPAGDVGTGDIVTFYSEEKGTYVTHRVVGRTAGGYVTKGDHNPTTDQRAGYAPVRRSDVVGRVLTVRGRPFVIPHLGDVVEGVRANAVPLAVLVLGALGVGWLRGGDGRRRDVSRVGDVFAPLFAVAFAAVTLLLAYGGGGRELTLVAVSQSASAAGPNVVHVGATKALSMTVEQPSLPLTHRLVTADGMAIANQTRNASAISIRGTLTPPTSVGPVRVGVHATTYPAVLPRRLVERLAAIHPLAAAAPTALVLLGPVWVAYRAVLDRQTPLRATRSRLRRLLREGVR